MVSGSGTPDVTDAAFIAEARDLAGLPPEGPPEIAIAGRSNVGKSTLLNRLAGRRGLARTSKTPGRTRGLVMFALRFKPGPAVPVAELRLVDLPGYGYAQVSRSERQGWQPLIEGYTRGRRSLALFVMLIDARRGIADEERQLYEWLGTESVPAQIVFTKVDKLSASERGLLRDRTRALFGGPRGVGPASPDRPRRGRVREPSEGSRDDRRGSGPLMVSGETGEGVPALWSAILAAAAATAAGGTELAPEGSDA
jgi:GTP-binding protein